MTQLGQTPTWGGDVINHVTKLDQLQDNSVIRNGCDTDDTLDRGTYFIKADGKWYPFNPVASSVNRTELSFIGDQIFLPVEQVNAKRLMDWRADMKAYEAAKPVRAAFEKSLGITSYGRYVEKDCDCVYDEVDCDQSCQGEYVKIDSKKVDAAWLALVKGIKAAL